MRWSGAGAAHGVNRTLGAGVRRALESALGHRVHVPPEPQFIVATGAAVIAAAKAGVPQQ
jgi:activator of 2-hydroxyglutaryl-CoA dehydratase